ncbi:MAG: EthD family reductase [Pseudomonadota bacterium]
MFKAIICLKRNDEWAIDDFRHWYLVDHQPLVHQLPGLQRANFNIVEGDGNADFDTVSELWFEDEQALLDAYATEAGQAVAQDSLSKVKLRVRLPVQEHPIFP